MQLFQGWPGESLFPTNIYVPNGVINALLPGDGEGERQPHWQAWERVFCLFKMVIGFLVGQSDHCR